MADSPASSLTSLVSEAFTEDLKHDSRNHTMGGQEASQPPSKRQRVDSSYERSRQPAQSQEVDPDLDLSSDTSGDIPASPSNLSQLDDEAAHEQVRYCDWEDCSAGWLGDMDKLVSHIHDVHIGMRQKKYSCEWDRCTRKGMPHASGYALRAHMRSHTREKPFFCQLPECDRSFTRSDALAKHMRTVHETEALRPSDPVPKSHSSSNPPSRSTRLKLILSAKPQDYQVNGLSTHDFEDDADIDPLQTVNGEGTKLPVAGEVDPLAIDPSLPPSQQFRILRRQLHWAEEEGKELKEQVEQLTELRKREWVKKELLINNVLEAEIRYQGKALRRIPEKSKVGVLPEKELPLQGTVPWYRQDSDEES
ncbi:MAG: hypothetical protein M1814_004351 [Vezdaea aestivalis]|nr:MAG: hypothetical protein M1814_004351 [Vezdaea aestivalis]